jgi:hypothetical protein
MPPLHDFALLGFEETPALKEFERKPHPDGGSTLTMIVVEG